MKKYLRGLLKIFKMRNNSVFIIIFFVSFITIFGQKKSIDIDTLMYQERYKSIKSNGSNIPIDSTKQKVVSCKDEIQSILKTYSDKKGKKYKALEDIYYKLDAIILFTHVLSNQYDSVVKHYEIITKNCSNPNTLGTTNNYRSYAELDNQNLVEALFYVEEAIKKFKLAKNKNSEIFAFLGLLRIHISTNNFNYAKELLDLFEKENDISTLSNLRKIEYAIVKTDVINELEGPEKAILFLNTIDLDSFENDLYRLHNYRILQTKLYLKSKEYKKALSVIQIMEKNAPNDFETSIANYILSTETYLGLKDYKKTLFYLNKIKEMHDKKPPLADDSVDYYSLNYKYHKALGNYKEALGFLEKTKVKSDSIISKNYKLKSEIQNYTLKKDSQLLLLNEQARLKDELLLKNKQFYIYSTILISGVIAVIVFVIMLYYRKRKIYTLKIKAEKSEEIAHLKNLYIENLSHEIRTPLTIIEGYIRLIRNNVFNSGNIINFSEKILKSTGGIIHTLNDFLTILRLENMEYSSKLSNKKIDKFLTQIVSSFEGIATLKGLKLHYKTNISESIDKVDFDFSSLEKIINNLIMNAIKYSNRDTSIYIACILNDQYLNITVKDEGIGMDTDELSNVFSRFYQSNKNNPNGGFGIGLSLIKGLIDSLNGTISVSSEKGKGSIFTVKLPILINNTASNIKGENEDYVLLNRDIETKNNNKQNIKTNKPQILIVDDELSIQLYLKELLKTDFNCVTAFNGLEALKLADKLQFDLIISDFKMPIMAGFQLKSKLNALENYEDVPFLIMTASIYEDKSESVIHLGIDDFIIKPFNANELLTRIYNLLENKILRNNVKQQEAPQKVELYGHYSELMDKINLIIKQNINNPDFSVDVLAQECNYSKRQLGRIIQAKTGLTPVKIILEVRLNKAYTLLQKKEYQTIKEVVYAVGLNSTTYFNRVFLNRFGIKPKDLLK